MELVTNCMVGLLKIKTPENGLFRLSRDGAVGKTLLYEVITHLDNKDIFAITYTDKDMVQEMYMNQIKASKFKLVYCDRFDLYKDTAFAAFLYDLSKTCCVVLDFKNISCTKLFISLASIRYKEGELSLNAL